jgi:hypothetical protein
MQKNRSRRIYLMRRVGMAVIAVSAAWLALFLFDPATMPLLPPCPFHLLTGLYCPGCGATRALHKLAHGNFTAALKLNPLVVTGLLSGGVSAAFRKHRGLPGWFLPLLLATIGLFGIMRNIPLFPCTLLAP